MSTPYEGLQLAGFHADRPWIVMNMVTTIDGKIVSGERNEPVGDLGSDTDHAAMRNIEAACDAVIIGAGSLRATPGLWYDQSLYRFVVTRDDQFDRNIRFFSDCPERAFVVRPGPANRTDHIELDSLSNLVHQLSLPPFGIQRLLVEGGSELNALFFQANLIDEIFWTIAPKVKLGQLTPTMAGGEHFSRDSILRFEIVSHQVVGDEVFMRYRRVQD